MAPRRRLWIIDPSVQRPEDEGAAEVLGDWDGDSRLFRPALEPEKMPEPGTGCDADGVVVMGSACSVHDHPAWLEPVQAWLRPILDGDWPVPLLGICYGHQLIAHLAGGEVGYLQEDRAHRRGIETSRLEGGRLLPGKNELRVMVSHREEVKRAPEGYRVCASRPGVAVDGLEHENLPVFSFQFHPEGREEFAAHAEIPAELVDERVREDGRRLLAAFRDLVRSR